MLSFSVDTSALAAAVERLRAEMPAAGRDAVKAAAEESLRRIQAPTYWKPRTGATARSFAVSVLGDYAARVASSSPIAAFINNGTKAHPIVARRAKFLRFVQNGAVRFAKQVRHPGTRAKNFEAAEQREGERDLAEYSDSALRRAVERSGLA